MTKKSRKIFVLVISLTMTIILSTGLCTTAYAADTSAYAADTAKDFIGTWKGSVVTNTNEVGLTIKIFEENGKQRGIVSWYRLPGKTPTNPGSFYVNVVYLQATGQYRLTPDKWIVHPDGYSAYIYTGKINGKVFSGTTDGGTKFSVNKTTKLKKPASLKLNLGAKKKTATWKKVANNSGYTLKVFKGKKQVLKVNIKKGKTKHTFTKKQLKKLQKGKKYTCTLVAKGKGKYTNSPAAKSKSSKMK